MDPEAQERERTAEVYLGIVGGVQFTLEESVVEFTLEESVDSKMT